jgi:hypothetical protein
MLSRHRIVMTAMLLSCCYLSLLAGAQDGPVQTPAPETTEQKIEHLTAALAQAQAQMSAYAKQLLELQQQLGALRQRMAEEKTVSPTPAQPSPATSASAEAASTAPATLDEIRERQAIDESQIASHDMTKVETDSKYPLKVSGLLLFNGYVNTKQVDVSAAPAYAIPGAGSTGFSVRQTVLGLDARGPHLFDATSHADLRVDFFSNSNL